GKSSINSKRIALSITNTQMSYIFIFNLKQKSSRLVLGHTVHSLSIGFRRLDCSIGRYALFYFVLQKKASMDFIHQHQVS
ncbi:hypothetical protein EFR96_00005, partial [Levilactobacillus brevis]|nr:hypothetical protein [Levilactobacillus brevis]